jgi:hypothetical protein
MDGILDADGYVCVTLPSRCAGQADAVARMPPQVPVVAPRTMDGRVRSDPQALELILRII